MRGFMDDHCPERRTCNTLHQEALMRRDRRSYCQHLRVHLLWRPVETTRVSFVIRDACVSVRVLCDVAAQVLPEKRELREA